MPQEFVDYAPSSITTAKSKRLTAFAPAVAVALILGGVVLIALPVYNNACWVAAEAALEAAFKSSPVGLSQQLPDWYTLACSIAGLCMIVAGVSGSLARRAA